VLRGSFAVPFANFFHHITRLWFRSGSAAQRPRLEPLRDLADELLRAFVEVLPRVGGALRASFLATDFLVALRGRAAVNAGFLFLPLVLFNFRGFSVVLATALLNALGAVETISFSALTFALAASITNSCATFATSRFAFDASPSAFRVELSPASPSCIVTSIREPCRRERHTQIRTGSIPVIKKTCAELDCSPELLIALCRAHSGTRPVGTGVIRGARPSRTWHCPRHLYRR
jgi:hypothetical protein